MTARSKGYGVLDHPDFDNHEQVLALCDPESGLRAYIALHSTALGPGLGGCRMALYGSSCEALGDVLRLSRGMTYKNAMAGLPAGGAKAVIMRNAEGAKSPNLLHAFGTAVEQLGGRYITAEDVGIDDDDVETIAQKTRHVVGRKAGLAPSGNPAPVTTQGVFRGIETCLRAVFGDGSPQGRRIGLLGVGAVGSNLARSLSRAGARLFVADIEPAVAKAIAEETGAECVSPEQLWNLELDVFSPNARGGALTVQTAHRVKARIVAGAANNQLADDKAGDVLFRRGVLYAPDYIINAGGAINCFAELRVSRGEATHYDRAWVTQKLGEIEKSLDRVFTVSHRERQPTHRVADAEARRRVAAASDKRMPAISTPICDHSGVGG